ncbi:MAG: oxidoreductase, partial [Coriobacteriia bacterium]|nr:oxidoreductase [Coriobacteriia bacterium]
MSEALGWAARHLPALLVLAPLAGAVLSFLAGPHKAPAAATATALVVPVPAFALAARVLQRGPLRYEVGGWGAPLGIDLAVDGLSALLICVTAVVGLAVTVYATGYFSCTHERGTHTELFWPVWLLLWAALLALFVSADAFNLYVCLELVSISAVILVGLGGGVAALRASLRYMFASMFASLLYLLGVALLYGAFGSLDLATLREAARPGVTGAVAVAAMTAALALKTALFPMHFWLPAAHASAPSPVSAALSALVVKASFYIALRLVLEVAPPGYVPAMPYVLGLMGAAAIVWGSAQALVQSRLKMMVAYSTVAQIGYLFLVFPLAAAPAAVGSGAALVAWSAVVLHAVAHALAKGAMFLSAGTLLKRYGHDRIPDLAGAARSAPASAAAFALAGVTMMGLPPSGGFVAKWMLFEASLRTGQWWWAALLVLGGLLAAAYVFRVVAALMAQPDRDLPAPSPVAAALDWVPLTLAVASL